MQHRLSLRSGASFSRPHCRCRAHHAFGGEFDANRPVLLKGHGRESRMGQSARVDPYRGDNSPTGRRKCG